MSLTAGTVSCLRRNFLGLIGYPGMPFSRTDHRDIIQVGVEISKPQKTKQKSAMKNTLGICVRTGGVNELHFNAPSDFRNYKIEYTGAEVSSWLDFGLSCHYLLSVKVGSARHLKYSLTFPRFHSPFELKSC